MFAFLRKLQREHVVALVLGLFFAMFIALLVLHPQQVDVPIFLMELGTAGGLAGTGLLLAQGLFNRSWGWFGMCVPFAALIGLCLFVLMLADGLSQTSATVIICMAGIDGALLWGIRNGVFPLNAAFHIAWRPL